MPCMYNGQPVKGNKGSCPYGSTWVEDTPQAPADDRNFLQKAGGYLKENPLEAASYAAMAIPGLGWAGGGALAGTRALLSGGKMASRTGNLMDKLFRKSGGTVFKPPVAGGGVLQGGQKFTPKMFNQTTKGGLPVQSHFSAYKAPYNKMAGRVMRKPSLRGAGMTGLAGAGGYGVYESGKDDRLAQQQVLQTQQTEKANNAKTLAELMDRQKQIDNAKKNDETPKKELTFAEKVKIGLKDKDTVYKLGLLMSELGNNDPNRASKLLEYNNALAKNSSSSYTALKNMILSPKELADAIYIDGGGAFGVQAWGGMDTDEKKAAAQKMGNAINALMHELAMTGQLPTWENARELYYEKNPDKDPRNKEKKPEEDEEKSWWDFT